MWKVVHEAMPAGKGRIRLSFTTTTAMRSRIDDFRFSQKIDNRGDAIIALLETALASAEEQSRSGLHVAAMTGSSPSQG